MIRCSDPAIARESKAPNHLRDEVSSIRVRLGLLDMYAAWE
jgi:hypothetical protein